ACNLTSRASEIGDSEVAGERPKNLWVTKPVRECVSSPTVPSRGRLNARSAILWRNHAHSNSRAIADAMGWRIGTVQKIWRAHSLAPLRVGTSNPNSRSGRGRSPFVQEEYGNEFQTWADPRDDGVVLSVAQAIRRVARTYPTTFT